MPELLPWHKEVTQGSKRLQTISMAEVGWAQAANRIVEKLEEENDMVEEMQSCLKSKKRLVHTTQLMQQLFSPMEEAMLSADAVSNYESMAYASAKLALGDACNLISQSRSNSCLSSKCYDMMAKDPETSERFDEQHLSKLVEDLTAQTKRLEDDFVRLDKAASIVDIRVECLELEKFSIINRFARFHTRGQPRAAETSTSSGTTQAVMKPYPQKYVTAFPMPRAVPEGAKCLSL